MPFWQSGKQAEKQANKRYEGRGAGLINLLIGAEKLSIILYKWLPLGEQLFVKKAGKD
ncbi:MAG: hypothetical protein VB108_04005 [Anaerolineaceae bacterium]|nr:hypothetical protein [Anaerolineaceae bacterium]